MVVFVDGAAARRRYRSFKIRGLDGLAQGNRQNDDFASMAEVLGRRVRRALAGAAAEKDPAEEGEAGEDASWALPDLMVIDGGKGQLGRVLTMLRDLGVKVGPGGVDVVSLAKERKVEIGRGKAALGKLREHREQMRSRGAALRAEEPVSAPPDFAGQLAAEAAAKVGLALSGEAMPATATPPVEAAPVRPGETYQDYVLHSEEDAGDDGTEIRPERVFVPGAKEAIRLRPGSSELYLMTQLRDEAHRFAITHHRKRRGKRALHSVLDDVAGVGPALKKALLQAFGSVAAIAAADEAALTAIKGVGPALARKIREAVGRA